VRGQALSYLTHLVLRLPLSPALQAVSPARRRFYIGYAVGCLLFLTLLVAGAARSVTTLLGALS